MLGPYHVPRDSVPSLIFLLHQPQWEAGDSCFARALARMWVGRLYLVRMPACGLAWRTSSYFLVRPCPGFSALMPTTSLDVPSPADSSWKGVPESLELLVLSPSVRCWGGPGGVSSCMPVWWWEDVLWKLVLWTLKPEWLDSVSKDYGHDLGEAPYLLCVSVSPSIKLKYNSIYFRKLTRIS